jgi:hypothetical protein
MTQQQTGLSCPRITQEEHLELSVVRPTHESTRHSLFSFRTLNISSFSRLGDRDTDLAQI